MAFVCKRYFEYRGQTIQQTDFNEFKAFVGHYTNGMRAIISQKCASLTEAKRWIREELKKIANNSLK